jgi:hypothetical protein
MIMMRYFLIGWLLCSTLAMRAQDEDIEYYTDSDVKRSIASLQVGYMPYYTSRRLLSESVNPQASYFFLNSSITGKYGNGYGFDLLFSVNSSLQLGIGLYNTTTHYQWDFVKIVDNIEGGNSDTLTVTRWDNKARYLTMPIQFGFVTQVAEQWWLQVYPALEVNFLQELTYEYELADGRQETQDRIQDARDVNLAISFGLGGEFRPLPKWGIFTRLQFRYFFFPNVEDEIVTEVIYTLGGHVGLRYYF